MKIPLLLIALTLLLGFPQCQYAQSIEMKISIKLMESGELELKGIISATGLLPENKSMVNNTITVTMEYLAKGEIFTVLPASYNSQIGIIYDKPPEISKKGDNYPQNKIKLLIAPLEKKANQIELGLDDLVALPESTTHYRVVATLMQQWQAERLEAVFKHAIHGPIPVITGPEGKPKSNKETKQQPRTAIGDAKQSARKAIKIPLNILLMIVIFLVILLVVVRIFKKTLKKT